MESKLGPGTLLLGQSHTPLTQKLCYARACCTTFIPKLKSTVICNQKARTKPYTHNSVKPRITASVALGQISFPKGRGCDLVQGSGSKNYSVQESGCGFKGLCVHFKAYRARPSFKAWHLGLKGNRVLNVGTTYWWQEFLYQPFESL